MSRWMVYIDGFARRSKTLVSVALIVGGLACQPPSPPERISGRGVVRQVVRADQRLVVAHEELPGLMRARTSGFAVRDPALLERVIPGERIRFLLEKSEQTLYLVAVEKEGETPAP